MWLLHSCAVYFTTLFNLARGIPPDAAPDDGSAAGGTDKDARRTLQVLSFVVLHCSGSESLLRHPA